jgi:hypothetical protein
MFLGHRPQREIVRYLEAIRELCASAPAPLVELGDVVAKGPAPELPRVFALPVKSPEAEVLQIGLRSVFTNQNLYIYEPRERTFWPHLTVARVRTADHKSRRPEAVHDRRTARSRRACGVLSRAEAVVSIGLKCDRAEPATHCWARPTCRARPSRPSSPVNNDGRHETSDAQDVVQAVALIAAVKLAERAAQARLISNKMDRRGTPLLSKFSPSSHRVRCSRKQSTSPTLAASENHAQECDQPPTRHWLPRRRRHPRQREHQLADRPSVG